jgi:hypothetical protein
MDALPMMDEPAPGELTRILDHGIWRLDTAANDLLQALRERAVKLADVTQLAFGAADTRTLHRAHLHRTHPVSRW